MLTDPTLVAFFLKKSMCVTKKNNNIINNNTLQMNPTNTNLNDSVSYTAVSYEDLAYIDDDDDEENKKCDECI